MREREDSKLKLWPPLELLLLLFSSSVVSRIQNVGERAEKKEDKSGRERKQMERAINVGEDADIEALLFL